MTLDESLSAIEKRLTSIDLKQSSLANGIAHSYERVNRLEARMSSSVRAVNDSHHDLSSEHAGFISHVSVSLDNIEKRISSLEAAGALLQISIASRNEDALRAKRSQSLLRIYQLSIPVLTVIAGAFLSR